MNQARSLILTAGCRLASVNTQFQAIQPLCPPTTVATLAGACHYKRFRLLPRPAAVKEGQSTDLFNKGR